MSEYTLLEAARIKGVTKQSVFYRVKKLKLGRLQSYKWGAIYKDKIMLSEDDMKHLIFRARNKRHKRA